MDFLTKSLTIILLDRSIEMSSVAIKFPEDFITDTKEFANKDYRTITQQIMYWADIGKKQELRNWQLDKMRIGLQQAKNNLIATNDDVERIFNKCK